MEENQNVNTAVETTVQSPETQVQETVNNQPTTPQEIEIDGIGKLTPEQIKEWKSGAMRQSDYTRKTQEVAKMREEAKEALELFNYLKANPEVAQALAQGEYGALAGSPVANSLNPLAQQINALNSDLASIKLDSEINRLKSEHPDFDEVAVLNEADKRGITDLEFIYNALKGSNTDPNKMKEQIAKEVRASILKELQQNNASTQTIVNTTDSTPNSVNILSDAEKMIALKMGLSEEQYLKGKNR